MWRSMLVLGTWAVGGVLVGFAGWHHVQISHNYSLGPLMCGAETPFIDMLLTRRKCIWNPWFCISVMRAALVFPMWTIPLLLALRISWFCLGAPSCWIWVFRTVPRGLGGCSLMARMGDGADSWSCFARCRNWRTRFLKMSASACTIAKALVMYLWRVQFTWFCCHLADHEVRESFMCLWTCRSDSPSWGQSAQDFITRVVQRPEAAAAGTDEISSPFVYGFGEGTPRENGQSR